MKPVLIAGLIAVIGSGPLRADPFEDFGTSMKYALPAAAALCALRQDRAEDFAVRGILQAAVVLALKAAFGNSAVGRRPNGEGRGFPSGHTASAAFGAADLAGKCFADKPEFGLAAYGAAGLTAASRIQAGEHTPAQVAAGALIGFDFGAASFGIGGAEVSFSYGLKF